MPTRRALVTGASSGIGREIARALAADGAHVLLPVRDRARGEATVRSILESVPDAALEICDLDLADFGTVTALGERLRSEGTPIDRFVMNAGIVLLGDRERHVTADGHELHLQTNLLGHAVLTRELMPLLVAARARVAVQVSIAATRGRLDDLEGERRYSAWRAYAGSKRALGLWALELARRSGGISVNLCHPGVAPATHIAPALRSRLPGGEERWLRWIPGNSPAQGAQPALMALERHAAPGCFFAPGGWFGLAGTPRERPLFRALRDPAAGRRLWELAEATLPAP
ncbi:SDR family NAD(P)-dependent oxidoreductase [Microbacterium bovistercoris]|nr:SDR family NAD(P)-dependent oxidoreductase [Microbacterium bovistercoris]